MLAGWASGSTYPLLGALRSSAQVVSYEIAMALCFAAVFLYSGTMSTSGIVAAQTHTWYVFLLLPSFVIYLISMVGETNRAPFDLPEAESELVAGYHSEYSAMKFSMFPISEYANMVTTSAMFVTLFLGGWDIPFTQWDNSGPYSVLKALATFGMFAAKVIFFVFFYIWIRWTLPRFRYDQLMKLGWTKLLPFAIGNFLYAAGDPQRLTMAWVLTGVTLVSGYVLLKITQQLWADSSASQAREDFVATTLSTPP